MLENQVRKISSIPIFVTRQYTIQNNAKSVPFDNQ